MSAAGFRCTLVAGGRHPELRGRRTLDMLATLADGGWIDAHARDDLTAAYTFLRVVEHRLQMVADEQVHTLPKDSETLQSFARFLGFADREAFATTLLGHSPSRCGYWKSVRRWQISANGLLY